MTDTRLPGGALEPVRTFWVGGPIPPAQRACLRSFLRVGHPVELYSYHVPGGVPAGVAPRDARVIMPESEVFAYGPSAGRGQGSLAACSNIFRYLLLRRLGGYWVDTDVFCLKPFPRAEVVVASERNQRGDQTAATCVLKFPPAHPVVTDCLAVALRSDRRSLDFGQIGPVLMHGALSYHQLTHVLSDVADFCPINWTEHDRLAAEGDVPPRSYGLHLWGERHRQLGTTIPWPAGRDSVLGKLYGLLDG